MTWANPGTERRLQSWLLLLRSLSYRRKVRRAAKSFSNVTDVCPPFTTATIKFKLLLVLLASSRRLGWAFEYDGAPSFLVRFPIGSPARTCLAYLQLNYLKNALGAGIGVVSDPAVAARAVCARAFAASPEEFGDLAAYGCAEGAGSSLATLRFGHVLDCAWGVEVLLLQRLANLGTIIYRGPGTSVDTNRVLVRAAFPQSDAEADSATLIATQERWRHRVRHSSLESDGANNNASSTAQEQQQQQHHHHHHHQPSSPSSMSSPRPLLSFPLLEEHLVLVPRDRPPSESAALLCANAAPGWAGCAAVLGRKIAATVAAGARYEALAAVDTFRGGGGGEGRSGWEGRNTTLRPRDVEDEWWWFDGDAHEEQQPTTTTENNINNNERKEATKRKEHDAKGTSIREDDSPSSLSCDSSEEEEEEEEEEVVRVHLLRRFRSVDEERRVRYIAGERHGVFDRGWLDLFEGLWSGALNRAPGRSRHHRQPTTASLGHPANPPPPPPPPPPPLHIVPVDDPSEADLLIFVLPLSECSAPAASHAPFSSPETSAVAAGQRAAWCNAGTELLRIAKTLDGAVDAESYDGGACSNRPLAASGSGGSDFSGDKSDPSDSHIYGIDDVDDCRLLGPLTDALRHFKWRADPKEAEEEGAGSRKSSPRRAVPPSRRMIVASVDYSDTGILGQLLLDDLPNTLVPHYALRPRDVGDAAAAAAANPPSPSRQHLLVPFARGGGLPTAALERQLPTAFGAADAYFPPAAFASFEERDLLLACTLRPLFWQRSRVTAWLFDWLLSHGLLSAGDPRTGGRAWPATPPGAGFDFESGEDVMGTQAYESIGGNEFAAPVVLRNLTLWDSDEDQDGRVGVAVGAGTDALAGAAAGAKVAIAALTVVPEMVQQGDAKAWADRACAAMAPRWGRCRDALTRKAKDVQVAAARDAARWRSPAAAAVAVAAAAAAKAGGAPLPSLPSHSSRGGVIEWGGRRSSGVLLGAIDDSSLETPHMSSTLQLLDGPSPEAIQREEGRLRLEMEKEGTTTKFLVGQEGGGATAMRQLQRAAARRAARAERRRLLGLVTRLQQVPLGSVASLMWRAKVVVTLGPGVWPGDVRTWEALASGALVLLGTPGRLPSSSSYYYSSSSSHSSKQSSAGDDDEEDDPQVPAGLCPFEASLVDGVEVVRFDSTNRSDFERALDDFVRPLALLDEVESKDDGDSNDNEFEFEFGAAKARAASIAARGLSAARNHHHVTMRLRGIVEGALGECREAGLCRRRRDI